MDWCVEVEVFFKNSRPSMKKEIVGAIKLEVEDRVHWVNWLSLNATRGRYLIFTLTGSKIVISYVHQIKYICPAYIYFYFRALRVNVDALKDTIKIIGQRQENVLNGTHKDHAPSLSYSCIIERKAKLNVFAMNKMVLYFGMRQGDATGCTLR